MNTTLDIVKASNTNFHLPTILNQVDRYRPTKSDTLNIKKQIKASKSFPVQIEAEGYLTVDLILLITAGNREIVTVNTINTLKAYTDIDRNIAQNGMLGIALTLTVLRIIDSCLALMALTLVNFM
jgi:hypothetical protein